MASSTRMCLLLFISSLLVHSSLGEIVCEELPKEVCAFSIASSGKRCVLETEREEETGKVEYQCRTSEVVVENMAEYIERDECVKACGVDRRSVGISSDALLEPRFTAKLCTSPCYDHCPNIVDLYFNLASAEGVFLPDLCEKQRTNPRRAMVELMSSGAAPGPISDASADLHAGPSPSPF